MLRTVSLFTGGGGLDLGLEAAGFHTLFASDIDEHSCITLKENQKNCRKAGRPFLKSSQILQKDITSLDGLEILESINQGVGEIDLLAGGPPCQAFSVFGKRRGREDSRGMLSYHYLRILADIQPKAFVFENVYGILTVEGGAVFEELKKKLSKPANGLRYNISVIRANAVDFGAPQFRDRVFIIGNRISDSSINLTPRFSAEGNAAEGTLRWRTVRDAFRTIPKIGTRNWHNHIGRKHSQKIIDRYSIMSAGERDHFTRVNRLDLSRPSFTIIVGSDAGGGKGHVHPTIGREVTPRESARIQCFPDWWWFSGTSRHPIRQIGNAVPSLLGYSVGSAIMKQVFQKEPNSFKSAVERLGQKHLFTELETKRLQKISPRGQHSSRPVSRRARILVPA